MSWPISAGFAAALKASNQIVTTYAELWAGASLLRTVDIVSGSVSVDAGAAFRRRVKLVLGDDDGTLIPTGFTHDLAPGRELRVFSGLMVSGVEERVPLGVFVISEPAVEDDGAQTVSVEGFDRARKVSRARFTSAYSISSGTNYATAIKNIISSRVSGLTYSFANTTRTTPQIVLDRGSDPWEAARKMASDIGMVLFFDQAGVCILKPEPNPATDPVAWEYVSGVQALLTKVSRSFTDEKTYNHPIVTGEGTLTTPVFAEARDTDPSSPTYYLGPFGDVPFFYSSPLITTTAQAQDVADALLRKVKGLTEKFQFEAIGNPIHDGGDIVKITRPELSVDDYFVLDSFSIGLGPKGRLSGTVRERRQ